MKYLTWGSCMFFAVVNIIQAIRTKDENSREHFLNRAVSYTAASFVCLNF